MAYFNNPLFGAEPFEEQGEDPKLASPDDLRAFYNEMEKKERQHQLERKASKRKSIWSRNSVKRNTLTATEPEPPIFPATTTTTAHNLAGKQPGQRQDAREMDTLEQNEKNDSVTSLLPASRSIVPDTLKELPEWYTKDNWSGTTSFRVRFPLHNPFGPRYYQNHHLIPPSMYRPGARPPSIFSPSFPAMGTSSMPERTDDNTGPPAPSRTPSHSPLPTPSSSQTRVADLDVSDPWGTNWHHESPYDIGMGSSPVAADADQSRSRRSSMTTQARRKTVTPSPLSQSTSALHLQAPLAEGSHMPRKLSKRRGLSGIFGSHGKSHQPASQSLPTSPVADIVPSQPPPPLEDRSKRASTMPPLSKSASANIKDRRGSILGRLTKRFSVTRKPSSAHEGHPHTDDHSVEYQSALHKPSEKNSKRVPPPSVENIEIQEIPLKTLLDTDRRSSISVDDASFPTTGKLMVANPDAPSEFSTPPQVEALLPVQQTNSADPQYWQSVEKRSSNLHIQSPPLMTSLNSPVQAQTPNSIPFASSPLNGHVRSPDPSINVPPPASSRAYSSRQSFDDKPLPKPLERVTSPAPSNGRRSEENRRPRSPERGPPPPSSTTKPIPLPEVSAAPPPPSVTTKPIPLPSAAASLPPSTTTPRMTKDLPLPVSSSSQLRDKPLSHSTSHLSISQAVVEDSPLSAASLLVNPPTPYVADDTFLHSELTPAIRRSLSREPSPGISSVTVRETETFKLVRTKSGNVQTVNEIISAAGEQWEVVEEPSPTKRSSKSRDKDRSSSSRSDREYVEKGRESRRDSRRQEKEKERKTAEAIEIDLESSDRHGNRNSKSHSHKYSADDIPPTEYSSKAIGRSSSMDSHHRSPLPDYMRQQEETRSGRTRDDGRRNGKTSKSHSASPTKPSSSSRPLERVSSKTTRPTSEVPPAADLTALRAREAWDMERLNKGRSMYGNDQNGETVAPVAAPTAVPVSSSLPKGSIGPTTTNKSNGALHGSSHTSFVVQNFGNQGATHIYHSMPTHPPPIIYGSTSLSTGHTISNGSVPPRASSTSVVSSPPLSSSPRTSALINSPSSDFLINRTPNPLPEPPRETHTPPRISQTFSDTSTTKTGRPAEYWTTYTAAEVTTAH